MSPPLPPRAALPAPDADALAHSRRLVAYLRELLADRAFLPFDTFMDAVLYAPGLGYYAAGSTKLGEAGDFVTAPELSPLFGYTVAAQVARTLDALGGGAEVIEFGAGSGALAVSVLDALARAGRLPAAYVIVEPSPQLRARQRERVASLPADLRGRVRWQAGPPSAGFRGVVLANEVLDAMPVARFVIGADGATERVREQGVEWVGPGEGADPADGANVADAGRRGGGGRLRLTTRPARRWVREGVAALERRLGRSLAPGYRSELAPQREAWLASVAEGLDAGLLLLIDYGVGEAEYYTPDRTDGTLICHYRHRAHDDPLFQPGLQDLTAWVDFSAVARAAVANHLAVAGFTTQAGFLLGNGFDALATEAFTAAAQAPARARLSAACRSLLLPGEMGERFRVLALTRGGDMGLAGFDRPDLLRTLQHLPA